MHSNLEIYLLTIPASTIIGDNFRILHYGDIVKNNCVRIGNIVHIQPGSFVNFGVPDNSLVLGILG